MSKRSRQRSMIPLDKMVEESIAFIREHEPPEGYFVGFSGGKDSIVTLELTRMAGVKHEAYYACTGIDPPEVVKFIKQHYPEVKWLYPKHSFWIGIEKECAPPLRVSRWCCDVLKKDPAAKIGIKHRLVGIRAEESRSRAKRPMIDDYKAKQVLLKPIFHWLEWHVWDFIDSNNLPYPSLYDEGFGRVGCMLCPFLTRKQHEQHRARWPWIYRVFENKVKQWFTGEQYMLKRRGITTSDDYLDFWYGSPKYKQPPCSCPAEDCAGITQTRMK